MLSKIEIEKIEKEIEKEIEIGLKRNVDQKPLTYWKGYITALYETKQIDLIQWGVLNTRIHKGILELITS